MKTKPTAPKAAKKPALTPAQDRQVARLVARGQREYTAGVREARAIAAAAAALSERAGQFNLEHPSQECNCGFCRLLPMHTGIGQDVAVLTAINDLYAGKLRGLVPDVATLTRKRAGRKGDSR